MKLIIAFADHAPIVTHAVESLIDAVLDKGAYTGYFLDDGVGSDPQWCIDEYPGDQ